MKKARARVAPIRKVVLPIREKAEEKNEDEFYFNQPENVEITPPIKKRLHKTSTARWKALKNTVRFKGSLRKTFEEIAYNLAKDRINSAPHDCHHAIQCLLEHPDNKTEENSLLSSGQARRKQYKRQSIEYHAKNKLLIDYFIQVSQIDCEAERLIDYQYLKALFADGVDINAIDKHGQSVLHEVARIWHTDVAKFLLENGANVNHPDDYGRTPLHVACAVDYPEMVELFIHNGASLDSSTYGEEQSAIHYAAKNDAANALRVLISHGADLNDIDYKKRTPLQLAAELDRSETALMLVEDGAPAGVYDESMMAAIVLMIQKMPNVAQKALDQFYLTNRGSRKQFFYLNFLNPPTEGKSCFARSPLEVAVQCKQYNLLLHPAFLRLIEVKWQKLGKWGAYLYGLANLLLSCIWTIRLCSVPTFPKELYAGDEGILGKFWEGMAVASLLICILSELREFMKSKRKNDHYKDWREKQLERDLQYTHPRWPEERLYLEREIRSVHDEKAPYITNKWNYFDWITYIFMFFTIISQVCNVQLRTQETDNVMRAVGSATLICLWLRMLKYSRPFKNLGPFIAILTHVVTDTLKITHLLAHIFIPFIAAFWCTFGSYGVEGYTLTNGEIFYSIFQMSVVGDYNYEKLEQKNPIMSRLLCFLYIFLGGIVCLNLFIALMSNTFQRVYDNVQANAIMQRASTIIDLESDINTKVLRKHREWITRHCSPESLYYDDDDSNDGDSELKRMTHQVKAKVDGVENYLHEKFGTLHEHANQEHENFIHKNADLNSAQQFDHAEKRPQHDRNCASSKDVKELLHSFTSWRNEYRRTIVQTRAEIAGLGLMFKELLEQNSNKKIKRENKRKQKWLSQLNQTMQNKILGKGSIVGTDRTDRTDRSSSRALSSSSASSMFAHDEMQNSFQNQGAREHGVLPPPYNSTAEKQTTQQKQQQQQQQQKQQHKDLTHTSDVNTENHDLNTSQDNQAFKHETNTIPNIVESSTGFNPVLDSTMSGIEDDTFHDTSSETLPGDTTQSSGNDSYEHIIQAPVNEGFFEGYTFAPQNDTENPDDRLIRSTWHSIFSQILNTQADNDDEKTSHKKRRDDSKEIVEFTQERLTVIESEDENELNQKQDV